MIMRAAIAFMTGFVFALAMCGCDPTPALYKAVAVGSPLIAGGYRALDAADKDAQDKIRAKAAAGDKEGAKTDLAAHLKKYDKAAIALDTAMATAQVAIDSAPVIKTALDKQASLDLIGQLLKLYEDARQAMKELGVDMPAVVF